MYISRYQVRLADTMLLDDNHHLLYSLELMVFHTLNCLDSKHMILCNDKLDLNLHPNGILFDRQQKKIEYILINFR